MAKTIETWLRENGAEQHAAAFAAAGYTDIRDVDEAVLKDIVKGPDGLLKRLDRTLKELQKPPDVQKPPEIPELPAGMLLDLSQPKATTPEGVEFRIPSALSVAATTQAIRSPAELDPCKDWPVIARNANLLLAYRMDLPDCDPPQRAKKPVLLWKVPAGTDFVQCAQLQGYVTSSITYSRRSSSFVRAGFTKVDATASYLFASASFEYAAKERHAGAAEQKELFMTGMWRFPRARLFLEECTQVSPRFVDAVRAAVSRPDGRLEALEQVFRDFGHVLPWRVVLGGQLFFQRQETARGTVNEEEREQTVKAAVGIKLGQLGVKTGVATGESAKTRTEAESMAELVSFEASGGDTTLASTPGQWGGTVKDPNLWNVIAIEESKSTVDLLGLVDADLERQVQEIWKSRKRHGRAHSQYAMDGRTYAICAVRNASHPDETVLAAPQPGKEIGATRIRVASFRLPLKEAFQRHMFQRQAMEKRVAAHGREHCQLPLPYTIDYPLLALVADATLRDAGRHGEKWVVFFSGELDAAHGDQPLYWIQHERSGYLLAWDIITFDELELLPAPLIVDPVAKHDPTGAGMGALWRLEPAAAGSTELHLAHARSNRLLYVDTDGKPSLMKPPNLGDPAEAESCRWRFIELDAE
jgi:hypothetical protein